MAARLKTEGALLHLGDGATPTEAFAAVANILSIDPPEASAEEVDQTQLDSTIRRSRPSAIPDPGEVSFTIAWDPEDVQHIAVEALLYSGTKRNWRIVYNSGDSTRPHHAFSAWVKSFKPGEMDPDTGDLTADVTLRLDSKPTLGTTTIS